MPWGKLARARFGWQSPVRHPLGGWVTVLVRSYVGGDDGGGGGGSGVEAAMQMTAMTEAAGMVSAAAARAAAGTAEAVAAWVAPAQAVTRMAWARRRRPMRRRRRQPPGDGGGGPACRPRGGLPSRRRCLRGGSDGRRRSGMTTAQWQAARSVRMDTTKAVVMLCKQQRTRHTGASECPYHRVISAAHTLRWVHMCCGSSH